MLQGKGFPWDLGAGRRTGDADWRDTEQALSSFFPKIRGLGADFKSGMALLLELPWL